MRNDVFAIIFCIVGFGILFIIYSVGAFILLLITYYLLLHFVGNQWIAVTLTAILVIGIKDIKFKMKNK